MIAANSSTWVVYLERDAGKHALLLDRALDFCRKSAQNLPKQAAGAGFMHLTGACT